MENKYDVVFLGGLQHFTNLPIELLQKTKTKIWLDNHNVEWHLYQEYMNSCPSVIKKRSVLKQSKFKSLLKVK